MTIRRFLYIVVCIAVLLAAAGSPTETTQAANPAQTQPEPSSPESPAAPNDALYTYLPHVTWQNNRIAYGRITDRNVPVAGMQVELRFYDGANWSTWGTTYTNSNGDYIFNNTPQIVGDQAYYARWFNSVNGEVNTRLWTWYCDYVYVDSAPGSSVCNFDIENVRQSSPVSGSSVLLPYTFTWTARQTYTDSYEFDLYDGADGEPYFYTPLLGYVASYRLASIPPGFAINTTYRWRMFVIGPNGYGGAFYYRNVSFRAGSPTGMVVELGPLMKHSAEDDSADEREARLEP